MNKLELRTLEVLRTCGVIDVLDMQITRFIAIHGTHPEIVQLNRTLKAAFVVELMKMAGLPLTAPQVAEPIFFGSVPIVFTIGAAKEEFMILQHKGLKHELIL